MIAMKVFKIFLVVFLYILGFFLLLLSTDFKPNSIIIMLITFGTFGAYGLIANLLKKK